MGRGRPAEALTPEAPRFGQLRGTVVSPELTPRESTLLSAAFICAQTHATLDAGVLFSALLLLGCHGMARDWLAGLHSFSTARRCGRRQQGGRVDDPTCQPTYFRPNVSRKRNR